MASTAPLIGWNHGSSVKTRPATLRLAGKALSGHPETRFRETSIGSRVTRGESPVMPYPTSQDVPERIAARYRLVEMIGIGGMARVFRAHDEVSARDVAVKLMAEHLTADDLAVRRFAREASIAMRLDHPNIVRGLDHGHDTRTDQHFIVMELVDGDDAARFAAGQPPPAVAEVVRIVAQVCDALQHAHRQGIVHGDVSPRNILVRHSDRAAMLVDFGLARLRWPGRPEPVGRVAGTPAYLAPEVADGYAATTLSDIYSLGAVAHRLLAGEAHDLGRATVAAEPATLLPALDELRSDVPAAVARAIGTAVATDPHDRHGSPAAFQDDLLAGRLARAA
jgi:eukaryotic-like serine/threonine-protein kinase